MPVLVVPCSFDETVPRAKQAATPSVAVRPRHRVDESTHTIIRVFVGAYHPTSESLAESRARFVCICRLVLDRLELNDQRQAMPLDPLSTARSLDKAFRSDCAKLAIEQPWFATFTLDLGGRAVEYRVGNETNLEARIIGPWHYLASMYYEFRPGEEIELERPFKEDMGRMVLRGSVTASGRAVQRAELADEHESAVVVSVAGEFVLEEAAGARTGAEGLPDVRALLTPEQYRLITSSRRRPVVIQGRAGSGKTTVALYRVSWLADPEAEPDEVPIDPGNVLIVMFNHALRTFVEEALTPLGLQEARLDTFHRWALAELKRAYRGEVEIDNERREGAETARRLKKQLGILAAIDDYVKQQEARIERWLETKLEPFDGQALLEAFRQDERPVARRLFALRSQAKKERDLATGRDAHRLEQMHKVFERAYRRATEYKEELLRFLCETELLAKHLPEATTEELTALAAFQREVQNLSSSERRVGPFVRFEDLALLLWLIQRKHGGYPNKLRDEEVRVYDHLVVDEAQDFGAVELNVLLSSVRSRTGVTIVGDANQKIVPEVDFVGWDRLMAELGVSGVSVAKLEVAHRSTRPIMELADTLVGDRTGSGRAGPTPRFTRVADADALAQMVARRVEEALDEGAEQHVCVVIRSPKEAKPFADALQCHLCSERQALVRVCYNKSFRFDAGVTVTNLHQIKGLEFDVVVVVEPSTTNYPEDDRGRRWLYTVLTRAKERLELVGVEEPTTLLRTALASGALAVEVQALPEVTFDEEDDEPF